MCKEFEEKIINYLIGEIENENEKNNILKHINECESCNVYFNQMLKTINYTKETILYNKTKFDIFKIEKKIRRRKIFKRFLLGSSIAAAIMFIFIIIPYFKNISKKEVIEINKFNQFSDASFAIEYNNNENYFENKFANLEEKYLLIKEEFNE